jgi:hypothetical protein
MTARTIARASSIAGLTQSWSPFAGAGVVLTVPSDHIHRPPDGASGEAGESLDPRAGCDRAREGLALSG